jgi:hypothetical protein
VSRDSLERSQRQARLQVASEDEGVIREFGLQYLFGVVDTAEAGEAGLPRYTQIWAYDRTERRERHPGLHVYHYNHYEPTSVDHLTELHGPRHLPDWSTSRTRMRPYWLAGW